MANIQQAAKWMNEGEHVRRSIWPLSCYWFVSKKFNRMVRLRCGDGSMQDALIGSDDMLAEDFEIAPWQAVSGGGKEVGEMASQNHIAFEQRRMLIGDDPHGFTLRDHPRNRPALSAYMRHEETCKNGGVVIDLMDDTPDGDVCCGFCCCGCDWFREFAYIGRHKRK